MILWFNHQPLYLEFLDLRQKHFVAIVVDASEIIGDILKQRSILIGT